MEVFLGKKYVMVSEENFEAYLVHIGLGYVNRKIALNVRPTQCLVRNDDGTYTFSVTATFFKWDMTFTPSIEFDSDKPDGTKIKTLITFEGNVMNHRQRDTKGMVSLHVLEFFTGETIVTTTVEGADIVARRVYKLVE